MSSNKTIEKILSAVKNRRMSVKEGLNQLKHLPFDDMGFAKIDYHRCIRNGFPEVVFAPGKDFLMLEKIVGSMIKKGAPLLVTKASPEVFDKLHSKFNNLIYHKIPRMIVSKEIPIIKGRPLIGILTAGTSDIPVAEEAKITCQFSGYNVETIYDVGVAGLHRLTKNLKKIERFKILIVVAGMEGALVSVVGGLVYKPIIAVPTSIGYGSSFKGLSALLTMLNSCAPGVSVVNIDNGFGAGYLASMLLNTFKKV